MTETRSAGTLSVARREGGGGQRPGLRPWLVEHSEVVRRRRMVRSFDGRPVAGQVVDRVLDAARRSPSAGFSQEWTCWSSTGPS